MAKEDQQLSPEDLLEALKNAAIVDDIKTLMSKQVSVNYKLLDDYLFKEKPPKTLVGLTIEKASREWPGNRKEVAQLLKTQIEKGADFPRTLAVESKRQEPRDPLKILLEIIFSESIPALETDAGNDNNDFDLEEIAAKAAENPRFLWAINGLYHYYCYKKNPPSAAKSGQYKTLEIQRKELHLHKLETDPYFRSLKWFLETSGLCKDDKSYPSHSLWEQIVRVLKCDKDYASVSGREELTDDIILGTLQLVSDIRDKIPATDSYLKKEYQQLSHQAEEFAVALIDEVQDEKDLSTVMKMEDKFSREGIEEVSLIQHAINLRCKSFVVSNNCQHLLKKVVFGESLYRFWDDPRVKTGKGMPALLILLMNVFLSSICAAFMTLLVPIYFVLSLANLCLTNRKRGRFFEMYERPCQKFLLEIWWFIAFLSLVIITSCENNFIQIKLPSGLTLADDLLLLFVVAFWLRLLSSFCHRLHTLCTIPRYRLNWGLIFPDLLTFVECASLSCFTAAFIVWIIRWNQLDGWRSSDDDFQTVDALYSSGSLLCFFKLAHYLKVQHTLGTLNLSLYMMITKDVIYFAIIFVILLYVPFATALEKMYSYYVMDNTKNGTHPLASYESTYGYLFWTMMGSNAKMGSETGDSDYDYLKELGEACLAVFTVAAVVAAFNMLIATMNHTYEDIMRNVDVEYVFSRTRMWMEYIAKDHSALPPPLNLADILYFFKCCCQQKDESANQEDDLEKKGNEQKDESANQEDDLEKKGNEQKDESANQEDDLEKKGNERIFIIKRLVFRYLRRSLGLDNSESSHDILTQSNGSREERDLHSSQSITVRLESDDSCINCSSVVCLI